MQVAVWDTYVTKTDCKIMHFDIIAPQSVVDEKVIYTFGKEYLQSKQEGSQELTTKECSFCHIEKASVEIERSIHQKGYYIYEMQNC
jgi:heterodisulfide reductase subunit B